MTTITRQTFVNGCTSSDGRIDGTDLGENARRDLERSGIPGSELQRAFGRDGAVTTRAEAGALYSLVERYVPADARESLLHELLAEAGRHRVRSQTVHGDALQAQASRVQLDVPGVNQMQLYEDHDKANLACFEGAVRQARAYVEGQGRGDRLQSKAERIQVAVSENAKGEARVDGGEMARARAYIDRCLDDGLPVVVGVTLGGAGRLGHNEGITDHFVTISGRGVDDEGHLFYDFRDPGDGGALHRFYVDERSGQLFKEAAAGRAHYAVDFTYQLTQVRTWDTIPAP